MKQLKNFYRLIQGDCLKVLPTLKNESIDAIITDPPYVLRSTTTKNLLGIHGEYITEKEWNDFTTKYIKEFYRVLKPNGALYIFTAEYRLFRLYNLINELKLFDYQRLLIWSAKDKPIITRCNNWRFITELIIFFSKDKPNWYDTNIHWNVLEYNAVFKGRKEHMGHPTQKPIDLIKELLTVSTEENNIVLDAFLGSGSTMVACQDFGRSCIGIEVVPKYCDLTKKRCFGRQFLDREVEYKFEVA